jgi:hypothetical protein
MRTPREILLARHRAAEPNLDDIRQSVVGELNDRNSASRTAKKTQSFPDKLVSLFLGCPNAIWHEVIWPARRIWAGLAAVWLLIFAVNFSMRNHATIRMAKSSAAPEVIMALRQQQQLLSELIGPDDPPVAEVQKTYLPRPASERRMELLIT